MNDIHALQRLFYPRSVVLIGASDRSPWSQMIAGNFQVFGYTGAAAAKRALAKQKPIVILKVGTSELTAQVAAAHTGSLVGDDNVFDAACLP